MTTPKEEEEEIYTTTVGEREQRILKECQQICLDFYEGNFPLPKRLIANNINNPNNNVKAKGTQKKKAMASKSMTTTKTTMNPLIVDGIHLIGKTPANVL